MTLSPAENYRRAVLFESPEWIPMGYHINTACWNHYDHDALQDLMEAHPLLFPGFQRRDTIVPQYGVNQKKDEPYTDPWGCVWTTDMDGITGAVTGHPLADWADFDRYTPPNPEETNGLTGIDWTQIADRMAMARGNGGFVRAGLPHGHTFLRLQDIRGYENLMFDMADNDPRLTRLIEMVADFNLALITRYIEFGANFVSYAEDLGMQRGPMLSPAHFRTYIKPVYERLMSPAREAGAVIHMHSDGDIRTLLDDMLDCGIDVSNLQDLVNGIDWIADSLVGRVCIDLDIDRQEVTYAGSPAQIDELIHEEVEKLSTPRGGLTMIYGLYPGVPLANIEALMDAMERYGVME